MITLLTRFIDLSCSKLPMYVHSWGGLGSQLCALSLILELLERNPKRKIRLVHHTSGVTRRRLEQAIFTSFGIDFREIDDFRIAKSSGIDSSNLRKSLKSNFLSRLLQRLHFIEIQSSNDLPIHAWTVLVRGHYYRRPIPKSVLKKIRRHFSNTTLVDACPYEDLQDAVLVHYRLGDLMVLTEKDPTPKEDFLAALKMACDGNVHRIVVNSDSPSEAKEQILSMLTSGEDFGPMELVNFEGDLFAFFTATINARIFVGTNSKLSYWIALLRNIDNGHYLRTYLPKNIFDDFQLAVLDHKNTRPY